MAKGPMSLEQCAAKMERFLASKPRSGKTLAYLKSLPKVERRRVSVAEYEFAREIAKKVVARAQAASDEAAPLFFPVNLPAPRKSRVRPKARKTQWACRPGGHRHVAGPSMRNDYPPRTLAIVETQRKMLAAAQDGHCALCGKDLGEDRPTIDHCIPKFMGGADKLGNLLAAHGECNGAKSNDAPTGCEMVWLLAVNARLGVKPTRW